MKHTKKLLALILIAAVAVAAAAHTSYAKKSKKEYVFLIPVIEGLSMGSLGKIMKDLEKVLSKKMEVDFKVEELKYTKGEKPGDRVLAKMKKGDADFTYFSGIEYVQNKKAIDKEMDPLFTITMLKKKYSQVCAFVRKDAGYKSVKDLKGENWGGVDTMPTRYILYKNGIKKTSMSKFFDDVKFVDDSNVADALDQLLKKKIDVYVGLRYIVNMAMSGNKEYSKNIDILGDCEKYEHNWIFFASEDVSKSTAKKFKKVMLNAHRDREFQQFQFIMQAIQGKFVKYSSKDLKTTKTIAKLIKKYDWDKEEEKFHKKHLK